MSLLIRGLGTAHPPHTIAQAAMARAALPCSTASPRQAKLLPALYRRAQVAHRHLAVLNQPGGPTPIISIATQRPPAPSPEKVLPDSDESSLVARMLRAYPPAHESPRGPGVGHRMGRYAQEAITLAAAACCAALADAEVSVDQVGQLVVVSCTGFSAPGVDIGLMDELGLDPGVGRTTVGFMGCHGAMNGLRVAHGLADTLLAPDQYVLMCCVELCSLHFQYRWDPQKVVANSLFGDGAAAVVGHPDPSPPSPTSTPSPPQPTSDLRIAAHGSYLLPDSRDAMTWLIRDHGFEMTLSPRVPGLIQQHLQAWIQPWLATQDLEITQVNGWAIHPGGPRVIASVETALHLTPTPPDGTRPGDISREILRRHGNMSSPTILFILDQLRQADVPRPWVALAFGPGLTIEAILIR